MKSFKEHKSIPSVVDLKSGGAQDIKKQLYSLLDQVTDKEVLELDREFYACRTEHEKNTLLTEFETSHDPKKGSGYPERNPVLLQRWAHYCWIRLELSYLASQQAMLNTLSTAQRRAKKYLDHLSHEKKEHQSNKLALEIPALIDSVDRAIQEDAQRGVPLSQSIETLRRVTLQIVGTEHPTDPLSQEARDILTKLANLIERTPDDFANIKLLLEKLQKTDSIPPSRRDVVEEVNRNMRMVLERLYDSTPHLIEAILTAYEKYYPTLYVQHEEEIRLALKGGRQQNGEITTPLVYHASWAGFDADGNANITPDAMRQAIRLHRIRIAEKHLEALARIKETSKRIENNLRQGIIEANFQQQGLLQNSDFQKKISIYLDSRDFHALVVLYRDQMIDIEKHVKDSVNKGKIVSLLQQQLEKAQTLDELTRFSGSLQQFMTTFTNYKDAIRDSTDSFEIEEKGLHELPTDRVLRDYDDILQRNKRIVDRFSELKKQARQFEIQLSGFRMTYGFGHVRQDSSVHVKVWNFILEDLKKEEAFLLKFIPNGKSYLTLNDQERLLLHKHLQNSAEGHYALQKIYDKFHRGIYLNDLRYRNHKDFAIVRRELERYELVARHRDLFECLIISNSKNTANVFEVESLMRIFPKYSPWRIMIVPLLEERADLDNSGMILTNYIKARIQYALEAAFDREVIVGGRNFKLLSIQERSQIREFVESKDRVAFKALLADHPILRESLENVIIEVMFGYSDTERVSGLPALISIQKAQDDFNRLTQDFGVKAKIFHGPGGDTNRGGTKRRDPKATLQGNARSNLLTTPASTSRFCETQFYHAHQLVSDHKATKSSLPHINQWINECEEKGAQFYEHLHDTQQGLGKLLGFMFGQGAHWMVTILNSSSRATHRGGKEDHSDRTASVQRDGVRPEAYIDPNNPRAITATQMKELLRDNIHLTMGAGYGLRMLGLHKAQRIYDQSETVRDMVHKLMWGLATSNFTITKQAFFAGHSELLPRDADERKKLAEECATLYPQKLASMDIEKLIKTEKGKNEVMVMMSRLFAYIEEETIQTMQFIFEFNRAVHVWEYRQPHAPKTLNHPMDLLFHYPEWQRQGLEVCAEVEPLSRLLAMQNKHVAAGGNLDEIYKGINDDKNPDSKLTGVGRLLGDMGAAITAYRITPPEMYEFRLNYRKNLRPGVTRGEAVFAQLRAKNVEPVMSKVAKLEQKNQMDERRISRL